MKTTELSAMSADPLLCSIPDAAKRLGRGTTFVYECISDGRLQAVKSDARTLVRYDSLRQYVDGLPQAQIKPMAKRLPLPQRLKSRTA